MLSWYEYTPAHQTSSLGFWSSPKTGVINFLRHPLQKTQTGESTRCRWNKKRPVGSKLHNNLYWNYMRYFSCVLLKMLLKTALISISFNSKAYALFLYALWCIASLDKAWINIFNTRSVQISLHKHTFNKMFFYIQTLSSLITLDCSQYPFIQENVSPDNGKFCFKFVVGKVSMWTKNAS